MAKTIINLSDPVSTLVSKTNIISNHLGDITQLNVGSANDSDIVQAINFVNGIVQKTDSADIINLIDSNYVQARQTGIARSSTLAFFMDASGPPAIFLFPVKNKSHKIYYTWFFRITA